MKVRKYAVLSIYTSLSLIIFMLESLIPPILPVPGVKLGLSNIVTLIVFFIYGPLDAGILVLIRTLLGSVLCGQLSMFPYSIAGGAFAILSAIILKPLMRKKQIPILSAFSAISHNLGQMIMAVIISSTGKLWIYFPILIISGIITGLFTGIIVLYLLPYLKDKVK